MKSLILAIALILMPAMAYGQQIRIGVNIGVHRVHPRVHRHYVPHVRHYYVYPPVYVHPTPYTVPYWGGYNYYPYGSFYRYNGIYLHVR